MKYLKSLFSSITSGIYISIGGILFCYCVTFIPDFLGKLCGSLAFCIGLTLISYTKTKLVTGRIGFLFNRSNESLSFKSVDIVIMLIGNFIGAYLIGVLFYYVCTWLNTVEVIDKVASIITTKTLQNFTFSSILKLFIDSLLCGAFVYIAVLGFKISNTFSTRIFSIFLPISLFCLFGFQHCVANVFYLAFAYNFNFASITLSILTLTISILITILGNFIGSLITNLIAKSNFSRIFSNL